MLFQWDESLNTGIDEIDRQHRELITNMNKLLAALFRKDGKAELNKMMQFLMRDYIENHFNNEEAQMEWYGYPDLTTHHQQHQEFLTRFDSLKAKFISEGPSSLLAIEIHQAMDEWCKQHIIQTDRKLAEFLKQISTNADLDRKQ